MAQIIDDGVSAIVHIAIKSLVHRRPEDSPVMITHVVHIAIAPDMMSGTCLETGVRIDGKSRREICEGFAKSMEQR